MANLERQHNNSMMLPLNISERVTEIEGVTKLSLYEDHVLDSKAWIEGMAKIKKAFPRLSDGWYDELLSRLMELKFTNNRFIESVKKMIDECKYPEPAIAEIIRFDKQVNLLTFEQVSKEGQSFGGSIWAFYEIVDIEGKPFYVLKRDIAVYKLNLKKWESKQPEPVKINKPIEQKKSGSLIDIFNAEVERTKTGIKIEPVTEQTREQRFKARFGR